AVAARLVATERVLDEVEEALVAVGARLRRAVVAALEPAHEVGVGDERPRDGDAVAGAVADRAGDHRGRLEAARAEDGDRHRSLERSCAGEVDALDAEPLHRPLPPPAEAGVEGPGLEDEVVT